MPADPQKLKVVKDLGRSEIFFSVARVPNSGKLFLGASDGKVYAVDTAAEKPEFKAFEGHTSYVMGAVLSGTTLVTGGYDRRLIWWNTETGEKIRTVEGAHAKWIRNLVGSPDGKLVLSVADDMLGKVWNIATGELVHTLKDHQEITPHHYPSMLFACTVSADGELWATGDKVGHIAVWNVASGEKVGESEAAGLYTWDPSQRRHSIGGLRSLAFSPDKTVIAAGGIGKIGNVDHLDGPSRLEVFQWRDAKKVHEIEDTKMKGLIERLAFDPSGAWLVGTGGDHGGFVNFYTLSDGKLVKQEKAPMHVHDLVLSETHDALYTVGHGKIAVWEFKGEAPAA